MQKLALGVGFDGKKPIYELCVKEGPLKKHGNQARHRNVFTVMGLSGMEMKNLSKVQKAVDTINKYSGNMEEEKTNA